MHLSNITEMRDILVFSLKMRLLDSGFLESMVEGSKNLPQNKLNIFRLSTKIRQLKESGLIQFWRKIEFDKVGKSTIGLISNLLFALMQRDINPTQKRTFQY